VIWVNFGVMTFWPIFWLWDWHRGSSYKILITIWYHSPICYLQHIKRLIRKIIHFWVITNYNQHMQTVLVNITQIKCKAYLLNGIILPCTTSMPGLGLQFVFRTSQKVKLTWQNYIPMVKFQCMLSIPYDNMRCAF